MLTLDNVSDYIWQNCEKVNITKDGRHFHTRCPICGDSKKSKSKKRFHLEWYDGDYTKFHCFNCNESGSFYKLVSVLECVPQKEVWNRYNKYDRESVLKSVNKKKTKKDKQKITIFKTFNRILGECIKIDRRPEGYIQTKYHELLQSFIRNRKINFPIFAAIHGEYKNRFIIPVFDGPDIIYFQGRRIYPEMEPKYLNPSVEKSKIILNKNNFDRNKHICMTEGIIDAHMIGNQGTSFLGKELSREFLMRGIKKLSKENPILVMDNDEAGLEKLKIFQKTYKESILYFLMPEKYNYIGDINELVVKENINTNDVYQFIVDNSYSDVASLVKLRNLNGNNNLYEHKKKKKEDKRNNKTE